VTKTLASAWHGTYLLDGTTVVREARAPLEVEALVERARRRADGSTTPEEETVLATRGSERWRTRDRRLAGTGVAFDPSAPGAPDVGADAEVHRAAMLRRAEVALEAAWDPSVHVEEAVRALRDIDRAANLIGERVVSWLSRDAPELESETPLNAARALLEHPTDASPSSSEDPAVVSARRRLAELLVALHETRTAVDDAVRASVPVQAPNLNRLLGPELAARLVAQAGGLDRLAHLPASTVQVLGAERAFFEHLRGRAPPPRHGLLFLHPAVQTAPRAQRGKLARALAAKAAIAARMDRAGAPVAPALSEAFEARRAAIRSAGPGRRRGRERMRSRPPLDRAPDDR
jgi:nucleolar protein 56